jgi:hypothetical protein
VRCASQRSPSCLGSRWLEFQGPMFPDSRNRSSPSCGVRCATTKAACGAASGVQRPSTMPAGSSSGHSVRSAACPPTTPIERPQHPHPAPPHSHRPLHSAPPAGTTSPAIVTAGLPPLRGRFTAWDSSRALQRLWGACWAYPPLVVDGWQVACGRVPAIRVVPPLDELEDGHLHLGLRLQAPAVQHLAFQHGEEALAHGVIEEVAH